MPQPDHACRRCFGLLRRRSLWVPTWKGCLLAFLAAGLLLCILLCRVHAFLAVNEPVKAEVLVVEAWVPDYILKQGLDLSIADDCRYLLLTGGTVRSEINPEPGDTYARMAMKRLQRISKDLEKVRSVPSPNAERDRTYASAIAVRDWLAKERVEVRRLNVMTMGPHGRRSRLLFEKAFGPEVEIGILSGRSREYDPAHWWRSSEGVKEILSEGAAYFYARFLFGWG